MQQAGFCKFKNILDQKQPTFAYYFKISGPWAAFEKFILL